MKHDAHIDLLRVAGAFTVVFLHVSGKVVLSSPDVHSAGWWVGNVFDAMSRWCVPIFVMVSGALLLSESIETEVVNFYRRRAARLLPPLVFWTVFYICLQECESHSLTTIDILKSLVHGTPYFHLWYLYMIAGLYLVTPFLRQVVIGNPEKAQLLFIVGGFVIASIETSLTHFKGGQSATFFSSFLPYIAYFVAGHYLYIHSNKSQRKFCLLFAIVGGGLVAFGTGISLTMLGPKSWSIMYSYLNPIVIVMSLCVFRFGMGFQFRSEKSPALLRRIAPITLGIYLIHPFWLIILAKFGLNAFFIYPMIGIPLTSIAAFGLSAVSSGLMGSIPFLKTIVR